jgi:hypothetical protein
MKIACIGYTSEYEHKNMFDIELDSSESILEYDLLVIDFDYLHSTYSSYEYHNGKKLLDNYSSASIVEDMKRRKNEILEFLKNGKDIVVILSKKDHCYRYTGESAYAGTGKNARKTNYVNEVYLSDTLPNYPDAIEGSGTSIEVSNKIANIFHDKYNNCFRYKAFVEKKDNNCELLKIKGTSKVVSYYDTCDNGNILYIPQPVFEHLEKNPSKKELDFFKDLKLLLDSIKNQKSNPLPEWTNNYKLPNESILLKNITDMDINIEKLMSEKEKTKQKLMELQQQKRLFTACDDELEEIVRATLTKIGFKIIKFGGNEEDILMEYNNKIFIVEIKGLDKSAAEKNAAQTTKWIANYFAETGKKPKGLLIVNAFKNKLLEERQDTFPNQMLKYSIQQEICLLSTIQLLNIYYAVNNNKIDIDKVINNIYKTNGVFTDFIDWKITLNKDKKDSE